MILGIGTDIAKIDRFISDKTRMDRLANKILTDYELDEYNNLTDRQAIYLAKKWSAKESISKAFGTGISGDTKWKSIEIRHDQAGRPIVCFYNNLKNTVETLQAKCHLSISDEHDTVVAYSIIEYS